MFCDLLCAFFTMTCAVAAWNLGLLNCWPLPIAFVVATLTTQAVYIDVSAWVVEQLKICPEVAVFLSYLLIWLVVDMVCVAVLEMFVPIPRRRYPILLEKFLAFGLGIMKVPALIVLATLASLCATNIACPPKYALASVWLADNCRQSVALHLGETVAAALPVNIDRFVVSTRMPRYQPHFAGIQEFHDERMDSVRDFLHALRDLEAEM